MVGRHTITLSIARQAVVLWPDVDGRWNGNEEFPTISAELNGTRYGPVVLFAVLVHFSLSEYAFAEAFLELQVKLQVN